MHNVKKCQWNNILKQSLLHHSKRLNDYCKCYLLHFHTGNGSLAEIIGKIKFQWPGCMDYASQNRKGFIQIKPFLQTKNEVIYGNNSKYLEWRISILHDKKHFDTFYFILLISYNSESGRYIHWPLSLLLKWYFKTRIKKLLRHPKIGY